MIHSSVSKTALSERSFGFLLLALLGIAISALTVAAIVVLRMYGDTAYIACAIASGFAVLAATAVVDRACPAKAIWLIVGIAILLRLILLFTEPLLSTDIYRYVWDGRVQAWGINPYRYVPADAALAPLRDASIFPHINRADYAVTIYPPVAEMFFFVVTRLSENVTTMKAGLLACEAVTVTVILLLLRQLAQPSTRIVAYAWHPLPLWQIANNGHVDALMTALMMTGIYLAITQKPIRGGIAVTLGSLAKPLALLALPVLWRRWDWRVPLVVIATVIICYAPYLSVGTGALGFLGGYLKEEGFANGDRFWLLAIERMLFGNVPGDAIVYFVSAALIIGVLAGRVAFRETRTIESTLADINSLLLASLFLLSPNYPWYFLAATPFVALVGGVPVWALTVGASLLHAEVGGVMFVPLLVRQSILYGGFLLACVYASWRARQMKGSR